MAIPTLAERAVERSLAMRQSAYAGEVHRLIAAGIAVMERTDNPRVADIVREAGLSNQAFYRHFRSKDELLAAILDDGTRTLLGYLEHQMAKAGDPEAKIRRWVEGVMAQAVDPRAAEATRAVTINAERLAETFRAETVQSQLLLRGLLHAPLSALGSPDPERCAAVIFRAVMGTMHEFLWRRERPNRADVAHLVGFCLAGANP